MISFILVVVKSKLFNMNIF